MLAVFLAAICQITLCLNGGSHAPVILAVQQGEHIIPLDTLLPDKTGCMIYHAEETPGPGQYMFVQNNIRLFNFLISSQEPIHMTFYADIQEGRANEIRVEGSEENKAYLRFYRMLQEQYARLHLLTKDVHDNPRVLSQIERLENTLRDYTEFLSEQYEGTMLSIIAKNVFTPVLSESSRPEEYLGYIDFADPRILNTAILPLRIKEYVLPLLALKTEHILLHTDRLLQQDMHPSVKSYVIRYLFSIFYTSDIMGMELVAFHLATNWLITDSLLRAEPELYREVETFIRFNKECLPGMTAPELILPDASGVCHSIHNLDASYTILVFFEDNCTACSKELLKLVDFFERTTLPDIQFVAIYTGTDQKVLEQYTSYFPDGWITLWDPDIHSRFPEKFNVLSTPKLYLLDKEKIIIGRDIGTDTIEQIIEDKRKQEIILPQAPRLMLTTENGSSYGLYDVFAPYTLLYLYDPACVSCKEVTDILYDLFTRVKGTGLMVYAVYTGHDYTSWRKWLAEGGYTDWVNVWNPNNDERIYKHFDLGEIPLIYLLDTNKGIIADHLSLKDLIFILRELTHTDL